MRARWISDVIIPNLSLYPNMDRNYSVTLMYTWHVFRDELRFRYLEAHYTCTGALLLVAIYILKGDEVSAAFSGQFICFIM